jgi:uncharacterized protein (TIGR03435 family)
MAALASTLSNQVSRVVLDRTELKGEFDMNLEWMPDSSEGPAIFTAVQEQLGLKLEPARGPVDVLVIESVEQPTPD